MFDIILEGQAMELGRRARFGVAMAAAFSLFAVSACDNGNALDNPGGGGAKPEITDVAAPGSVAAGDTMQLTVSATGERNIVRIIVRTQASAGSARTDTFAVDPIAKTIAELVEVPLSSTLSGTSLNVTVTVEDEAGKASEAELLSIPISDSDAPTVDILNPPSPTAGDTAAVGTGAALRVEARVVDNSGIAEVRMVGYAFRGDPELGTDQRIERFIEKVVTFPATGVDTVPTDTIIRRDLVQQGDSTEAVLVIVTATDLFGNTTSDTVPVIVGGPNIAIVRPTDGSTHRNTADLIVQIAVSDSAGVESASLDLSGILTGTVTLPVSGLPKVDTITYTITSAQFAGATGGLTLRPRATNARGIPATGAPVSVTVVDNTAVDNTAPAVTLDVTPLPLLQQPLPRVEQLDTISVTVAADDQGGTGVVQLGALVAVKLNHGADSLQLDFTQNYATPQTNPTRTFRIPVDSIYDLVSPSLAESVELPDSLDLRIRGYAFDQQSNSDTVTVANGVSASRGYILAVGGYTISLPGSGIISDAVIDTVTNDERLFLSNYTQSRVDVLELRDTTFVPGGVLAGSQPWGLFIADDTLVVANSGGTNFSKVDLRAATLTEAAASRVYTPEVVLYQVNIAVDDALNERYEGVAFGYSDRPQFLAVTDVGDILFSTMPPPNAPNGAGTIRRGQRLPGWNSYEITLLYPGGDPADEAVDNSYVIANADSLGIVRYADADSLVIYDHVLGFPSSVIMGVGDPTTAAASIRTQGGDVIAYAGGYLPQNVILSDTTFVAASGDRKWVAFGEGATAPTGRVIMWNASIGQSTTIQISDLVDNAAERVTGIGLNQNGTLGVFRGDFGVYFFTQDLRQQGSYTEDINPGGFGATFHPSLATYTDPNDPAALSFVGTAESTVKIIDTFHFFAVGELPIKQPLAGPLRATLPLPGFDNVGLTCPGNPQCVVIKLFGVVKSAGATDPDGVVIIDVREKDLN